MNTVRVKTTTPDRRRRRVVVTAVMLAGSLVVALPGTAMAARPPGDPAPLSAPEEVSVAAVPVKAPPPDFTVARALRGAQKVAWPAAGVTDVDLTPAKPQAKQAVPAGNLPVRLIPPTSGVGPAAAQPAKVRVEVLDRKLAERAGTPGVMVRLSRADGMNKAAPVTAEFDYSAFRGAFGGDWASRLQVVTLPSCAATTPDRAECRAKKPLATRNDAAAGRASAAVTAEPAGSVFALAAAPAGPTGDYTATPLSPAGSWGVGLQSGTFTWQYPFKMPEVPGGLAPSLGLSYSSGTIDGRVVSTNNQASWVGDGWSLGAGAISWQFKPCADDGVEPKTGDLCWAGNYATMSFGSHSSELIFDDDAKTWRPRNDDGTRVEYLAGADNGDRDGNHWRVTTTDGTQYYFGSKKETQSTWTVPVFGNDPDEPCHGADYAGSSCDQAWTWNLDYVVDRHHNTIKYFYDVERNSYGIDVGRATAGYTRGGTLRRVEYGANEQIAGAAPAVVDFDIADRCVPGADCAQHTKESYVDTPWDQQCDTATCDKYSPTFFSSKRLAKVTTKMVDKPVDSWALDQSYPDPGDKTSAALWLKSVTHTGLAGGSAAEPPVVFNGDAQANRVNSATDGLPPMNKYRIAAVRNETGGSVQVNWAPVDCTPASLPVPEANKQRCFPVRWSFGQVEPRDDWFTKYVVGQIVKSDLVGGALAELTTYEYLDGGAWHFGDSPLVPADKQTWADWRGYGKVIERHGDPAADPGVKASKKEYRYFRGMNGDRLNREGGVKPVSVEDSQGGSAEDSDGLAGFLREEITFNGTAGAEVSGSVTDPFRRQTAKQGSHLAYVVQPGTTHGRTALASGGARRTESTSTYNDEGILTQVNDLGDVGDPKDDRCKTIGYARDPGKLVLTLPSQEVTVGVACGAAAAFPGDSISDVRTFYDDGGLGAPPTTGATIRTEVVDGYPDGKPSYVTNGVATFDGYGRGLTTSDALGRTSKVAYEPTSGPPAKATSTDPAGNATVTTLDRTTGKAVQTVDVNGRRTDVAYDPLGRVTQVWKPGRSKDSQESGHVIYGYDVRNDGVSSVTTQTLKANENYVTSYALYDGFGRSRQTQSPAWMMPGQKSRVLTDTIYDSRGLEVKANGSYLAAGSAGKGLVATTGGDADVPSQTTTEYDGAERTTASVFRSAGLEQWRSSVEHRGDSTAVTPPKGETATTTLLDARGRAIQLSQHQSATPTAAADVTKYSYTKAGLPETVTDAAGNIWSYTYDVRGRRISAKDPDKGESTMTYDAAGQLLTKKDARQKLVAHKYDVLGRRIETRADSAVGRKVAEWTYDTVTDTNGPLKGLLASSTRYVGADAYKTEVTGYDVAYRPTATTVTIPASETGLAGTYKSTAGYNADGSLRTETRPKLGGNLAGETVSYGYDDYGMPSTMAGADTYVGYSRYTPFGEREMVRLGVEGAETWERRGYELASHRLSRTTVEHAKNTDLQSDVTYGYDPGGNAKSLSTKVPGVAEDRQCFGNDYLRRITEAWTSTVDCAGPGSSLGGPSPYWSTFGYDQVGNRKTDRSHGLGGAKDTLRQSDYPAAGAPRPHAPTAVTTTGPAPTKVDSYAYSETGGTIGRPAPTSGNQVLAWDVEDRVVSATAGAAVTTYAYDANGNRLTTRDATGATLTLPDGSEVRYDTATGIAKGSRFYTYGGSTIAVRKAAGAGGVNWMFQDRSGSDTVSVNAGSFEVNRRLLDPFGRLRQAQPANWPSSRGFAGGAPDPGTGLTHLGARDYDAKTGKFVSVDAILALGSPQQFNAYAYADNNPATKSDPTGLIPQSCPDGECQNGHGAYPVGGNPHTQPGGPSVFDPPAKAKGGPYATGKAPLPRVCRDGWDRVGSIGAFCGDYFGKANMPACKGNYSPAFSPAYLGNGGPSMATCWGQMQAFKQTVANDKALAARAEPDDSKGLLLTCEGVGGTLEPASAGYEECTSAKEPGAVLHTARVAVAAGVSVSGGQSTKYVFGAHNLDDAAGWGLGVEASAGAGLGISGSAGISVDFDKNGMPTFSKPSVGGTLVTGTPTFRPKFGVDASAGVEYSWVTR
ncbi:RHS repeat-associated core domain-containing protein [Amycolatopsis sp. NPDC051128]|uniref:RHS repeat domain-containing protein n=1 Tax=Amycolatopsis sp. NPDC051128 TaxID=3155412 RepID=UPI0034457F27